MNKKTVALIMASLFAISPSIADVSQTGTQKPQVKTQGQPKPQPRDSMSIFNQQGQNGESDAPQPGQGRAVSQKILEMQRNAEAAKKQNASQPSQTTPSPTANARREPAKTNAQDHGKPRVINLYSLPWNRFSESRDIVSGNRNAANGFSAAFGRQAKPTPSDVSHDVRLRLRASGLSDERISFEAARRTPSEMAEWARRVEMSRAE